MQKLFLAGIVGIALVSAPSLGRVHAQQSPLSPRSTTTSNPHTMPSIDGTVSESEDPNATVRQAQMARVQNNERQKRIVDDTNRLVKLANELKEDVDKSNKDQMSLEVIRKADEVERLAHDVKIRMRG